MRAAATLNLSKGRVVMGSPMVCQWGNPPKQVFPSAKLLETIHCKIVRSIQIECLLEILDCLRLIPSPEIRFAEICIAA